MVARLIHRYGVCDAVFPGARAAGLDEVRAGCAALFGLASAPGEPAHPLRALAAQALRDAAHLEAMGEPAGFRLRPGHPDGYRLDLGDLQGPNPSTALRAAARAIADRGARPVLLGGTLADALACLQGVVSDRAGPASQALFLSPGLGWARPFARLKAQSPALTAGLALGTHDFVPEADFAAWAGAGGRTFTTTDIACGGSRALDAVLQAGADLPAFVVLDLSCIDMGHAAGATGDNVGGLEPREFLDAVGSVGARLRWLGAALVNLAPERDPRGHSERLAARALLTLLGEAAPGSPG